MNSLYKAKQYSWSLFIGHLVIEKLLKAIYYNKTNQTPSFTHDLSRLVDKIVDMELTENQLNMLDVISTFNINARYDDYKRNFHKKCDKRFTTLWNKNIKDLRKCLKENYLK